MNYFEILKSILYAGAFVLSMFFAIKIMTATIVLREHWRTQLKHRFYMSRRRFNLSINILAVVLLIFGMWVGWIQMKDFLRSWFQG